MLSIRSKERRDFDKYYHLEDTIDPIIDEDTTKCNWHKIFLEDCQKGSVPPNSKWNLPQYEQILLKEIYRRVNPSLPQSRRQNVNIVITAKELGLGKSLLGANLAYLFFPEFSYEDIVTSLAEWAKRIIHHRKNYWICGDEVQKFMSRYQHYQLDEKVQPILDTQRGMGANFVWTAPSLGEIYIGIERTMNWVIYLRYRCGGEKHTHGYIWERASDPRQEALILIGKFTWPNPFLSGDDKLISILKEYEKRKKPEYMEGRLDDLRRETEEGGFLIVQAKKFIEWTKTQNIQKIKKGHLMYWINKEQEMQTCPKAWIDDVWKYAQVLSDLEPDVIRTPPPQSS